MELLQLLGPVHTAAALGLRQQLGRSHQCSSGVDENFGTDAAASSATSNRPALVRYLSHSPIQLVPDCATGICGLSLFSTYVGLVLFPCDLLVPDKGILRSVIIAVSCVV